MSREGAGVIAIDGPAGSGKSTVASAVATRLGLEVLDTGAMYRAVTWAALDREVDPHDHDAVSAVAAEVHLDLRGTEVGVDGTDVTVAIRQSPVAENVSIVAAHPGVRAVLRDLQRAWMSERGGGVVEGRDIGTVVFPDASLKVYLTASHAERARRRSADRPGDAVEAIANEIESRDRLDSTREDSPLRIAEDALVVDTTTVAVADVVDLIAQRYGSIMGASPREGSWAGKEGSRHDPIR